MPALQPATIRRPLPLHVPFRIPRVRPNGQCAEWLMLGMVGKRQQWKRPAIRRCAGVHVRLRSDMVATAAAHPTPTTPTTPTIVAHAAAALALALTHAHAAAHATTNAAAAASASALASSIASSSTSSVQCVPVRRRMRVPQLPNRLSAMLRPVRRLRAV